MKVEINVDKTVRVVRKSDRGLTEIFATGLVEIVNRLDIVELIAVLVSVKHNPFPLQSNAAERTYTIALNTLRSGWDEIPTKIDLGELRKYVLIRASQGCNAPHDHYLKVADQVHRGVPVDLYR